jgi:hypothetical protein
MDRKTAAREIRSVLYAGLYTASLRPRYYGSHHRGSEVDIVYKEVPEALLDALRVAALELEKECACGKG